MHRRSIPCRRGGARRAFTLVESVLAVLIMGILMVAAIRTLGSAGLARTQTSARANGRALADALIGEISSKEYKDTGLLPLFGREATEVLISPRTAYDDVDDYDGLSETPPVHADGTPVAGAAGLKRQTKVDWVPLNNLKSNSGVETGAKRITVTVSRNGVILARRVTLRTQGGG